MNTISSLAVRLGVVPAAADQSVTIILLVSGLGLAASLGAMALGFDLGAAWV